MNVFTRTLVFAAVLCLLAAIIAPALAGDTAPLDRPIEIRDALKASTHEELSELIAIKMQALADLLGDISAEAAARDRADAAVRYHLELELLQARLRMLPATAGVWANRSTRHADSRKSLDQQLQRIAAIPEFARHLRSVVAAREWSNQDFADASVARF